MAADDFAEFYQGTWRRIVTFVYAMSGDLAEAEDLAHRYLHVGQRGGGVQCIHSMMSARDHGGSDSITEAEA